MPSRDEIKRRIAIMQAWVDGEEIQVAYPSADTTWEDITNPVWNWQVKYYRKKPKPREWYLVQYATGVIRPITADNLAHAESIREQYPGSRIITLREVIDE